MVVLLLMCAYLPARDFPFMFDSVGNITGNSNIRVTSLSTTNLYKAAMSNHGGFRPIPYLTFALNYYFSGADPGWYRIVNIFIHLTNIILLCCILFHLLKSYIDKKYLRYLPAILALFWGLHPTASQSVTYIVQRMNSLMALFYLLTLLFYILARQKKKPLLFIASGVSFLLAILSKENAAILPVIIWLIELYFFAPDSKRFFKKSLPYIAGVMALLATIYIFNSNEIGVFLQSGYAQRSFTMAQRVLTEFRVVIYYLSLLFFPYHNRLTIDQYFTPSTSLLSPMDTFVSLVLIITLIVFAAARFKKNRLISFGIVFYFVTLIIESSVIGLELAYEHRLYIPSIGLLFVLAGIVTALPSFFEKKSVQRLSIALSAALVLSFTYNTYMRNMVYRDTVTFLEDAISKAPKRARLYNNLGNEYKKLARLAQDKEKRSEYLDKAEGWYLGAIRVRPDYGEAYNNLGNLYRKKKQYKAALSSYEIAMEYLPKSKYILNNYATSLRDFMRYDDAKYYLKKALSIDPCYQTAVLNMVTVYEYENDSERARKVLKKLISCQPANIIPYASLANILIREDAEKDAISLMEQFIERNPGSEYVSKAKLVIEDLENNH